MKAGEFSEEFVLDITRKSYDLGNAPFEIKTEKSAMLVIDMQEEFVKPHWTL